MNEIIKTNDLSFYNDQGVITLSAKQYDTGRKFVFNIVNDGEIYDLSGCSVYLRMLKVDGKQFQGEECCSIENNQIVIDTSVGNGDQILTTVGDNICELHLTDSKGKSLTTWDFIIDVKSRVHDASDITSDISYDTLDNITENILILDGKVDGHIQSRNNPHEVTKEQIGLGDVENKSSEDIRNELTKDNVTTALGYTPYTPTEVDNMISTTELTIETYTDEQITRLESETKAYTDFKIDSLVGEGASTTLDTIGEISKAIEDNEDILETLNTTVTNKADKIHVHEIADVTGLQDELEQLSNGDSLGEWRNSGVTAHVTGVAYGNGIYVAISNSELGGIYTSTDSVTWTRTATIGAGLSFIAYGNGVFVITTTSSPFSMYYSTDGVTWTLNESVSLLYNNVFFLNDKFINFGNSFITYSTDGITWTSVETMSTGVSIRGAISAIYANGKYLMCTVNNRYIYHSTDGITWTYTNYGTDVFINSNQSCIAYNNGVYMISDSYGNFYKSYDTENWALFSSILGTSNTNTQISSKFIWVDNIVISYGNEVANGIYISYNNGLTWGKISALDEKKLSGNLYHDGKFMFGLFDSAGIYYVEYKPTSKSLNDVANVLTTAINKNAADLQALNLTQGVTTDSVLNTLAEIEAATEENLIAGALAVKELSAEVSDCFQSVSDGKELVASAITDMGVSTASNATFQTMANNIKNISSGTLKRQMIKTYNPFGYGTFTIDIKTILPNHYSSLTTSNFAFADIGLNLVDVTQYDVPTVSMSYSASNGVLTLYSQGYLNVLCKFKFTVVCYYIK